jgi:hypothetical protein
MWLDCMRAARNAKEYLRTRLFGEVSVTGMQTNARKSIPEGVSVLGSGHPHPNHEKGTFPALHFFCVVSC